MTPMPSARPLSRPAPPRPLPSPSLSPSLLPLACLPLALAAVALAPAAQAGPFEDAFALARPHLDHAAECFDPDSGSCSHPCDGAEACFDEARREAVEAAGQLQPALDVVREACGPGGCGAVADGALAAVDTLPAEAVQAIGDAWQDSGAADAVEDADGRAQDAQARLVPLAERTLAAIDGLPATLDATVPVHVSATCERLGLDPAGSCAVWFERDPLMQPGGGA